MERRYRLTGSADFQRVRRTGKAYAHPLVILMARPNGLDLSRFGVAAGRRVGGAVVRNRAKRLLRQALGPHLRRTQPGWDLVLIARPALLGAPWSAVAQAVEVLMQRSGCLVRTHDDAD